MKKRLLSLLLALVMVVGMLPTTVLAAQPAAPATVPEGLSEDTGGSWDGERYDVSWYNTTDKEFTISDSAQLAGLARLTNGTAEGVTGAVSFSGTTVKLARTSASAE